MLEIHQNNDINKYSKYFKELRVSFQDAQIVEAVDKNGVIGFSIFSYENDIVNIYYVDYNNDKYLCDGIIRTVLFKASLAGIDKAKFKMKDLSIAESLKFIENGSDYLSSIQSVMDNCCNCKKSC